MNRILYYFFIYYLHFSFYSYGLIVIFANRSFFEIFYMSNKIFIRFLFVVTATLSIVGVIIYYKYNDAKINLIGYFHKKNNVDYVVGSYDRDIIDNYVEKQKFQHIVIDVTENITQKKVQKLLVDISSNKSIIITVNTFSIENKDVLQQINNGKFDVTIGIICDILKKARNPIYLRFNPEMEVPVILYPWQYNSPILYVNTFRRFAKISKKILPKAAIVWGPAGYPGLEEFWPGDDVVDLITLTVNSKSELQATGYPPVRDMTVLLKRKIHRVRFMDKPVLILGAGDTNTNTLAKRALPMAIAEIRREQSIIYSTATSRFSSAPVAGIEAKPTVGVYDPTHQLTETAPVKAEHLFVDLEGIESGAFRKDFAAVTARKHDIIVTVEPLLDKKFRKKNNVLLNTINGKYDFLFKEVYSVLATTNQTVYLRFAHEMEIPIERYPWQSQDPVLYIKAFRYFMKYNSPKLRNVKRVWGPAGDRGSIEWWPGDDVVDYVSVAIYGLPDKNITDPKKQESFSDIYNRKSYRMRLVHKPIFITEFGVKGPEDFQSHWLEDAANTINQHREIVGVCYFNLADNPKVWGNMPAPDWSISRDTFIKFDKELATRR
ncbi:hypothetical protein H8B15_09240 [Hymenobacter sp. BT507]|uniref:GH26 domain-containing protein n=1 Tax=Hymenobacter citatus TaxID=2763506 RepID=A0ABR7MJ70_9BACT|nr:hypothetical protein [Hymenobacter citatus]MBC6611107.1 hypothetical protein [Hymenobacter citatus]